MRHALILNSEEIKGGGIFEKHLNEVIVDFWDDFDTLEGININILFAEFKKYGAKQKEEVNRLDLFRDKASITAPFIGTKLLTEENASSLANDINQMTRALFSAVLLEKVNENSEYTSKLIQFTKNLEELVILGLQISPETLRGNRVEFFKKLCEKLQESNNLYALKIVKTAILNAKASFDTILSDEDIENFARFSTDQVPQIGNILHDIERTSAKNPLLKGDEVNGALVGLLTKRKTFLVEAEIKLKGEKPFFDLSPLLL